MRLILALALILSISETEFNYYSITIRSKSNQMIRNAIATFGKERVLAGYIGPDKGKTHAFYSYPVPEQISLSWTTTDEVVHNEMIYVRSRTPSIFNLEGDSIILTINDNHTVTLSFSIKTGEFETEEIQAK